MPAWEVFKSGFTTVVEAVFEYDTPKIVHIKNKKVGLLNRLVQLGIIGYIVGYTIVYQKGYNVYEDVVSAVTTKTEGLGYTDGTGIFENAGDRVWDSSDFIIPPQSPNSVFIMTNMWITNQTQGICPDRNANCSTDEDCPAESNSGSGILTGECNTTVSKCMAKAWCPEEDELINITMAGPKLTNAPNFTIFIKNTVQFPTLASKFRRRNVQNFKDGCRFNFNDNYGCPIFSVQQIMEMLEVKYTFDDLAITGAVLGFNIEWDCNLDVSSEKCQPKYSARRIDDPDASVTKGFNFRFANTWVDESGIISRQLTKAYGIRIEILVSGQGGKFSFSALILKLGSGIALLAVATVVSDVVILYVLHQKNYYRRKKYLNVQGEASIFTNAAILSNKHWENKDIATTGLDEKEPLLSTRSGDEDDESKEFSNKQDD